MNNEYSAEVTLQGVSENKKKRGKRMRKIFGILIIILSIALALYVGVWLLFVGGIVQVINSINPLDGMAIAIGILKIISASIVGWIIGLTGVAIGGATYE